MIIVWFSHELSRITWLMKTHWLLFDFYMNCRKNKLNESKLKLLTKQIRIIWNKNTNRIVILLNFYIIKAFDTISHERLIHDLRKKKNIEVNNRLNDQLFSKSHDDFDDELHNDYFVLDINKKLFKIFVIFHSSFILQCWFAKNVR